MLEEKHSREEKRKILVVMGVVCVGGRDGACERNLDRKVRALELPEEQCVFAYLL